MTANQKLSGGTGYALERIEIFRDLDPREIERLTQRVNWRNYTANQQIIGHQEGSTDVYFMVSGTVRVILFSSAGKEVAFRDIHAGECFGEFAAIDGAPRSANVIALSDVMIGSVSAETFRSILEEFPAVSMAMLTNLIGTVRSLSERIFEFSTLAVKNRIHSELLRLARESERDGKTARISPAPTHADIASRISTHREAVTRELNDLTKSGLISRDGRTLIISDMEELERLVHDVTGD
ncbi:Crp/Fnr family transcriptional regulator [Pelagibius marinus]|uniref:Crp/Fnr family transcriptional regulator n=1 Tax=Pelagibius marinus TaxID=2762760 RepID=UPI0018728A5F|nr:Crp/Fnr family transcriptional regulator [Pelagibius marinus]